VGNHEDILDEHGNEILGLKGEIEELKTNQKKRRKGIRKWGGNESTQVKRDDLIFLMIYFMQ